MKNVNFLDIVDAKALRKKNKSNSVVINLLARFISIKA